ncbi:PrGVORF91 [Pieris rapae granulovirus Wuhan]|uniref:PrGVORF91 n=1 Tax=Pieris rapae granulovirus Wuhan TaxID=2848030 RepID=D2J4Q8_9BBAC|nr:PrGVORF91 [Betabaculovirus arrapae]ACZ63577.1 PrGVORF91 [Betabaculovirus arrapae]ADO85520.1 unknown [Pieris rapae granulovirus]AHD24845.1 ORF91 [Pieris rapae granulovirus]UOS85763.1 ORF91 [Pieris rapae granulovirus]
MLAIYLIVGLVLFAFIVNRCRSSELLITILVLIVLFFCILHLYYNNTDSDPQDLYNKNVKKMKKKQQLNDTFDALLNKNTSSIE